METISEAGFLTSFVKMANTPLLSDGKPIP